MALLSSKDGKASMERDGEIIERMRRNPARGRDQPNTIQFFLHYR